jgi:hypothetical protein
MRNFLGKHAIPECVYKNVAQKTATVSLKDLVGRQIQIQSSKKC